MRHFVFKDCEGSGNFIVKADNYTDALAFAELYFHNPKYLCEYTEEEAEMSGLDEY